MIVVMLVLVIFGGSYFIVVLGEMLFYIIFVFKVQVLGFLFCFVFGNGRNKVYPVLIVVA